MKKIFLFIVFLLLPLMVTGCGEKQLKCVKEEGDIHRSLIATLKSDKLTKIVMEETKEFEDSSKLDESFEQANSRQFFYKLLKGVDYDLKKDGNKLISTITINLGKAESTIIKELFDLVDFTPDAFIEFAKNDGYVCE